MKIEKFTLRLHIHCIYDNCHMSIDCISRNHLLGEHRMLSVIRVGRCHPLP